MDPNLPGSSHCDEDKIFGRNSQEELRDQCHQYWHSVNTRADIDNAVPTEEVCHISISCSVANPPSSQEESSYEDKNESGSPPIISDEQNKSLTPEKEDEKAKTDLDTTRKSADFTLDNSTSKAQSPTSSVTSQRKLEWDSLADIGYANFSEKKISSSLSTLERLAMQQQLSISKDVKDNISGEPNAFSTPQDDDESRGKKNKRSLLKNVTKITDKEIDIIKVNTERMDEIPALNFTKHITFNVDSKTGNATVSSKTVRKEDKIDMAVNTQEFSNKEIQTSLSGNHDKEDSDKIIAAVPLFLNLDALKKGKYRGLKYYRTKKSIKKKKLKPKRHIDSENHDKTNQISEGTFGGSQVSETDSFEYMPAHVYQQNNVVNEPREEPNTATSNKTSSLDSTSGQTTASSKHSQLSLTKDLEKSIALLNKLIQHKHDDMTLKKKLVKQVVRKLIKTNYRDDDDELFSGSNYQLLKFRDATLHTTTSTSDGNYSEKSSLRQRKPILRSPKNVNKRQISTPRSLVYPSTQSGSNNGEVLASGENTSKDKSTSDGENVKTSSEYLYQRYLEALIKEQRYKDKLKMKEECLKLKQKNTLPAGKSETIKDLMDDLTGANKASGDAKNSINMESLGNIGSGRLKSHSVFTVSSVNNKLPDLSSQKQYGGSKKDENSPKFNLEERNTLPKQSKGNKSLLQDQSIEKRADSDGILKIDSTNVVKNNVPNEVVCFCSADGKVLSDIPDNFLIYQCRKIPENDKKSTSTQYEVRDIVEAILANKDICDTNKDLSNEKDKKESANKRHTYSSGNNSQKTVTNKSYSVPGTSRTSDYYAALTKIIYEKSKPQNRVSESIKSSIREDALNTYRDKLKFCDVCFSQKSNETEKLTDQLLGNELNRNMITKSNDTNLDSSSQTDDLCDEEKRLIISPKRNDRMIKFLRDKNTCTSDLTDIRNVKVGPSLTFIDSQEAATQVTPKGEKLKKTSKVAENATSSSECANDWLKANKKAAKPSSPTENKKHVISVSCDEYNKKTKSSCSEARASSINSSDSKEEILKSIEAIIKRYDKAKNLSPSVKRSRHRHYKEIIDRLYYLLRTENSDGVSFTSNDSSKLKESDVQQSTSEETITRDSVKKSNKSTQFKEKSRPIHTSCSDVYTALPNIRVFVKDDSSDIPGSTVFETSEPSQACYIMEKIKESGRFSKKHHSKRNGDVSSSTSGVQNEKNKENPEHRSKSEPRHCKCKRTKQKICKSVAYNLIIQSSDSFSLPERKPSEKKLKDVIVKVPKSKRPKSYKTDHAEKPYESDVDSNAKDTSKFSKSSTENFTNISTAGTSKTNEVKTIKFLTVREYLERNRPDFINNTTDRQKYLRVVSQMRKRHESLKRQLVSMHHDCSLEQDNFNQQVLEDFAQRIGEELRDMRPSHKLMEEREMKQHSRRIYKTLPEVRQRKEKIKKENIKRANHIMTSLFNKNLQKRALKGTVDISNYSQIIKI